MKDRKFSVTAQEWRNMLFLFCFLNVLIASRSSAEDDLLQNETAAAAASKAFAQAEEIYHRTDYNRDGFLEYAQAIRGGSRPASGVKALDIAGQPKPTPEEHDKIETLIKALGNDDFELRERASQDLSAFGPKAAAQLQAGVKSQADPEVVSRCGKLLEHITRQLTPNSGMELHFGLFFLNGNDQVLGLVDRAFAEAECPIGADPLTIPAKNGYLFRVLTQQGASAVGGKRSYIPDGKHLNLGYALLAFPKEYGKTGKKLFIINNNGTIFEWDCGDKEKADAYVKNCVEFDPVANQWEPVK